MSQKLKVSDLCPHKDNDYFFDDITGEAWQEFIDSIKTSGVIEPIVVTQNKVIVSGHQRVRACKFLDIEEIDAEVRIFDSDDEILKCLIETNIRQRGIGNTNPVKFGRCLKELERIYGVRDGSAGGTGANQHKAEVESNNFTEADLADQLGLTRQTLQNYKSLANAIPEIQTLVETGIVTPTTARAIMKKLPEFQQKELADKFASEGIKVPLKKAEEKIERLKANVVDLREERDYLQSQVEELQNAEPKVVTETVEKVPADYESLKEKAKLSDGYKKDFSNMRKRYDEMADKWKKAEAEKNSIISEMNRQENEKAEKIKRSALFFCAGVSNFIEKYGGYIWLTQEISNMEESERIGYIKAVNAIEAWAAQMKANMEGIIE